jgi:hypothetical protein
MSTQFSISLPVIQTGIPEIGQEAVINITFNPAGLLGINI